MSRKWGVESVIFIILSVSPKGMSYYGKWYVWAALFGLAGLLLANAGLLTLSYLFMFAFGTVILVKGADVLVENASKLAMYYGVSSMIVGLTVVAFGTSVPELAVTLVAAIKNISDISIGTIVGSNISNIGLILGLSAAVSAIRVNRTAIKFDSPLVVFTSLFLLALSFNLGNSNKLFSYSLSRIDGLLLLTMFGIFMYFLVRQGLEQYRESLNKHRTGKPLLYLALLALGTAGVVYGGKVIVSSASDFARSIGVSDVIIGLSIVAVGTSLPELVTSLVAALKKKMDIAVGNILGSNIFNTLWVLGLVSVIRPLGIQADVVKIDMPIMLLFSVVLLVFMRTGRKLSRWEGVTLLLMYLGYVAILVTRGITGPA